MTFDFFSNVFSRFFSKSPLLVLERHAVFTL